MARRNSKAKSPGYYIVDKDFVLGGATGDRLLRRTKRGVPSGSIDFGSEGRAQSELGYLRRTGRLPLFARGASVMRRNPDVRLTWTQRGHTVYDPTGHGEPYGGGAWWRTGLKKPKEVKRAVRAAHKYALKQKDWLSHRVTVENPRMKASESFIRTLDAGLSKIMVQSLPPIRYANEVLRYEEKVLDHFKAHPSQLYYLVHDAVTPGHKHNARFDMPIDIAFHTEGNALTDAQIETAVKHVIKKRASHSSNPKLRPFSSKAMYSTPYYSVQGRQYDDYATARAMAEKFSQESGRAVPIMKKDDAYLPAYMLQKVDVRSGGKTYVDDVDTEESWLKPKKRNPRRKRSYKRRNPVVRRKRRAPKRGYRKLSRAAKRHPRNAKGQFIKVKRKRSKRR